MEWIRSAAAAPCIASVCTGSLLLGAAGLLRRRRATTHSSASEELAGSCAEVSRERIVEDGPAVTARGVTSSLDLGLYQVEKFAGAEVRALIQAQMDYR